jgi:hypothetical protein
MTLFLVYTRHYVAQICKKLKRKKTYVQKIGMEKEDPMTLMLS